MKLPQLSLRDLFLLVALVAIGCGWWVERAARTKLSRIAAYTLDMADENQALREYIKRKEHGNAVFVDRHDDGRMHVMVFHDSD